MDDNKQQSSPGKDRSQKILDTNEVQTPKRETGRPIKEKEPGIDNGQEKRSRGRPRKEIDHLMAHQKTAKPKNGGMPKELASFIESLQMGNNTIVVLPGTSSATALSTTLPTTATLDQNTNNNNNVGKPIEIDILKTKVSYYKLF